MCWSQDPADRPSAASVVSMVTSPQFCLLWDIVSMGPDVGILCGVAVPPADVVLGECHYQLVPAPFLHTLCQRYPRVLALCALLSWVILKGLTLQNFVLGVCVCLFCFMFAWGLVLWIDSRKGLYNYEKSFKM